MTIRSRTIGSLFIVFALAAPVAGCASGSGSDPQGGGTGALGEAPAGGQGAAGEGSESTPTPTPAPPEEEVPADPTPGPGGTVTFPILTLNPGVLLGWPSPADCTSHNPATVTIMSNGDLWQVVDGSHYLLAYKREVDAQAGLALARAYKKHCFIGRNNSRPERHRYIMDYWLEPVPPAPAIASPDCLPHVPGDLIVKAYGDAWRVESTTGEAIHLFDTKADAENAVLVMKHYNRHCYIGRGYTGTDRLLYITDWFASV